MHPTSCAQFLGHPGPWKPLPRPLHYIVSAYCWGGLLFLPIQHCLNVSTKEKDMWVEGWVKVELGGGGGVQGETAPQEGGQNACETSYFSLNIKSVLSILHQNVSMFV